MQRLFGGLPGIDAFFSRETKERKYEAEIDLEAELTTEEVLRRAGQAVEKYPKTSEIYQAGAAVFLRLSSMLRKVENEEKSLAITSSHVELTQIRNSHTQLRQLGSLFADFLEDITGSDPSRDTVLKAYLAKCKGVIKKYDDPAIVGDMYDSTPGGQAQCRDFNKGMLASAGLSILSIMAGFGFKYAADHSGQEGEKGIAFGVVGSVGAAICLCVIAHGIYNTYNWVVFTDNTMEMLFSCASSSKRKAEYVVNRLTEEKHALESPLLQEVVRQVMPPLDSLPSQPGEKRPDISGILGRIGSFAGPKEINRLVSQLEDSAVDKLVVKSKKQ